MGLGVGGLHETGVVGHHGGDTRRGGGYMRLVLWDVGRGVGGLHETGVVGHHGGDTRRGGGGGT